MVLSDLVLNMEVYNVPAPEGVEYFSNKVSKCTKTSELTEQSGCIATPSTSIDKLENRSIEVEDKVVVFEEK